MARAGQGGLRLALLTGSQLQPAHVTNYCCGIKCLLRMTGRANTWLTCNTSFIFSHEVLSHLNMKGFTFHLLLAKFFLIWALTDSWIFLSNAVSPAILKYKTDIHIFLKVSNVSTVCTKAKYPFEEPICCFKATFHLKRKGVIIFSCSKI